MTLCLSQSVGLNVGILVPWIDYRYSSSVSSVSSPVTYSSVSLGQDGFDRCVIVGVGLTDAGTSNSIIGVTVAGVSCTKAIDLTSDSLMTSSLWIARVPSGSSGDVVVTFSTYVYNSAVGVWSAYNLTSTTARSTSTSSAEPGSLNLTVINNSVAVGFRGITPAVTSTWTGLTENFDFAVGANQRFTAASAFFASGGSKTLSVDSTGTPPYRPSVAAYWA